MTRGCEPQERTFDMPRIYPLFSSSKGNATYIGSTARGILVDCGVSCTRLKKALELNGLSMDCVKGIFITHEHSDHVKGLEVTARKYRIPVYSSTDTLDVLSDRGLISFKAMDIKGSVGIAGMTVTPFETSHDAADPCGYRIDFDTGESCCTCTDLGYVSKKVKAAVKGTNAILLEANYDETMLREGPYPAELKERIRSKYGHLSNKDSGEFAAELVKSGTARLILGHLSQENNTPETAVAAVTDILYGYGFDSDRDYILSCAPVETGGGYIAF